MDNEFLEKKIINKLKSGNIKMKPKIYFILKALFFLFLGGVAVLLGLFLISFVFFIFRINNLIYLFGFGFFGIGIFLRLLPWILVFSILILVLILELIAEKHRIVWRKPAIYSLVIFVIIILFCGFFISKTNFHPGILKKANQERLPLLGGFYREFSDPKDKDVHFGTILEIKEDSVLILTLEEEELEAVFKEGFFGKEQFKLGDKVIVLGEREENKVNAFRIKKIDKKFNLRPDSFRQKDLIFKKNNEISFCTFCSND